MMLTMIFYVFTISKKNSEKGWLNKEKRTAGLK